MLSFDGVEVLTFDCYGTLIDWETGILEALRSVVDRRSIPVDDARLLAMFAEVESPIQQAAFRSYRTVLDLSMTTLCRRLGFEPSAEETTAISRSLPGWRPFPDTVPALADLASRFRLGIISNVDDDLFAASARQLGVTFDWVVTAQQVKSYKPSTANFTEALRRIGRPKDRIVHCAQSLFHDIGPAHALGLKTVWVERPTGRAGATPPATAVPDLAVPDLESLSRASRPTPS